MLKFKTNNYKILVLGDVQVHGLPEDYERTILRRLVEKAEPDFIVFLGDMISGVGGYKKKQLEKMIRTIVEVTAGDKTPFTVVSGNHDNYVTTSFANQLSYYRSFKNCLTPAISARSCKSGYNIDLLDKSENLVFRLLFLDCAGTKVTHYGISFKKTKQATLDYTNAVLSDPNCPPTIVFQHIIVPDVFRLFDIRDQKFLASVRAHGPYRGLRLSLAHPSAGILGECPCPSWKNTKQFSEWVKSGKVRAAVFAHDHKNNFEDCLDGIRIIQTSCAGLSCYGNDSTRGARLITLTPKGTVTSAPLFHRDLVPSHH